jgi:hypothetical protein
MRHPDSEEPTLSLSATQAAAVDAIMLERAAGHAATGDEALLRQCQALLRLLDAGPTMSPSALIEVTLARVARERARAEIRTGEEFSLASLRIEDADALDALSAAGWSTQRVAGVLRARAEQHDALRQLVVESMVTTGSQDLLVARTLARVQEQALRPDARAFEVPRPQWRWREVLSVAAVLLLGVSILSPILAATRSRQVRLGCASNLTSLARGLASYGIDNRDSLPMASASLAGLPWWNVGQDVAQSNSANLFSLRRLGYNPIEELACAGNAHAARELPSDSWDWRDVSQVSYSYFVMFGRERPDAHTGSSTVLLADRSPVILRALRGEPVRVLENSPNHAGTGQWLLRGDGSTVWTSTPVHHGDNVWLPANLELALDEAAHQMRMGRRTGAVPLETRQRATELRAVILHGTEAPANAQDSFVGP